MQEFCKKFLFFFVFLIFVVPSAYAVNTYMCLGQGFFEQTFSGANVSSGFSVNGDLVADDYLLQNGSSCCTGAAPGAASDTNETTRFNNLVGNCTAGELLFGVDDAGNGVCVADSGGGNESWNQSHAATLFADISVVDTNTNCSSAGICSTLAYLNYNNTGNLTIGTGYYASIGNANPLYYFDVESDVRFPYLQETDALRVGTGSSQGLAIWYHAGTGDSYIGNLYNNVIGDLNLVTRAISSDDYKTMTFTGDGNLIVEGRINSSNWDNVTITEAQVSDLTHTTDTNESTRMNNLLLVNCSGEVVSGFYDNGTAMCEADDGGGNSSWNQSHAATLFADISVTDTNTNCSVANSCQTLVYASNTSWVEANAYNTEAELTTLLDDNYADISVTDTNTNCSVDGSCSLITYDSEKVTNATYCDNTALLDGQPGSYYLTGGNASWNQSHANTLYAPISLVGDNASWNQSHAATLFADISVVDTNTNCSTSNSCNTLVYASNTSWLVDNASYCADSALLDGQPGSYYLTGGNASWNQSHANTLYAPISLVGDNASWNQSHAATLFADISVTDTNTNCSVDGSCSLITYDSEKVTNATYCDNTATLDGQAGSYYLDNLNTNCSTDQICTTILYISDLPLGNQTLVDWGNLTSIPEGFADGVDDGGGNSSWNQSHAATLFADISVVDTNTNCSVANSCQTLVYASNTSWVEANAYNTEAELTTLLDDNYADISVTDTNTNCSVDGSCSLITYDSEKVTNATYCDNTALLDGQPGSYYLTGGNASWNQSHADSLYAPISLVGDNASWNQSHAATLFADISVTDTNTNCSVDGSCSLITYDSEKVTNATYCDNTATLDGQAGSYYLDNLNTNCSTDNICSLITYDSETTAWDKDSTNDVTNASHTYHPKICYNLACTSYQNDTCRVYSNGGMECEV